MGVPRIGVVAFAILFAACRSFENGAAPSSSDAGPDSSPAIASDGGTSDAAPGASFCLGAAFCDDFERLQDPKGPWGSLLQPIADDTADLTADQPQQGQHALRFAISATDKTHHASLKKTLSREGKDKAAYRFAYRPPKSFGAPGHTDLAYLSIPNGAGSDPVQVALLATNTGLYLYALDKTGPAGFNTEVAAHLFEEWNEAVIHVDFASHVASFEINGKPGTGELHLTYDDPLPGSLEVWLGPDYGSQQSAFVIDFDAARLDLQ